MKSLHRKTQHIFGYKINSIFKVLNRKKHMRISVLKSVDFDFYLLRNDRSIAKKCGFSNGII